MAVKKYLISCADVKANGFINKNFEDTLLSAIIWRVQEKRIQAVLGTALYLQLCDLVQTAGGVSANVAQPYRTLLTDYVLPCIVPMIEERATSHNKRISNIATGEYQNTEHFQNADRRGTTDLKQTFASDVAHYRNLLIKYLIDNRTDFANYVYGQECTGYNPESKSSSVKSMIFISGGVNRPPKRMRW